MEKRTAERSLECVVGLDIGTTKICAIVGARNEFGKIEVLGIGKAESSGVMRGVVTNIDKTVAGIEQAIAQASEKSGVNIVYVNVGIAGQHIKSYQHRGIRVRHNIEDEIGRIDIDQLTEDMYKLIMSPGEEIIHALPQEFTVDNESGIVDPVGMSGVRLEANFHIITGQVTAIANINKCVRKAGLETVDIVLEPLASSEAVLSAEEKEAGVVLIDIGGGTTDIAIFHEGIIRHTAVIPFGGNSITEDIKEGCMVMKNQSEQLKVKFGCAIANEAQKDDIISIPGLKGHAPKEVSVKNLASIIQARMEEILDHVYYEIKASGYENKLIAGIVVTGGGAQLRYLPQLVEFVTGLPARIGYPNEHLTKAKDAQEDDVLQSPMYATSIGLVMKGFQYLDYHRTKKQSGSSRKAPASAPILQLEREENQSRSFFDRIISKAENFLKSDFEDKDIDDKDYLK